MTFFSRDILRMLTSIVYCADISVANYWKETTPKILKYGNIAILENATVHRSDCDRFFCELRTGSFKSRKFSSAWTYICNPADIHQLFQCTENNSFIKCPYACTENSKSFVGPLAHGFCVRIIFVISRHNRSSWPRVLHTVHAFSTTPSFSSFIIPIPACHPFPPRTNHNFPCWQENKDWKPL